MSYYGKTQFNNAFFKWWIDELKNGNWEKREQDRKLLLISDLIVSFKNESLNKKIQHCRRIIWNVQKKSF